MRELANSFAQLIAIIMMTLALAVSYAAVSQWASADASSNTSTAVGGGTQTPSLMVAGGH